MAQFHGRAIALDIKDKHAPLPILFLVHEYMVRGRNFYQPTPVEIGNSWQDWIVNDGLVNDSEGQHFSFKRNAPASGPPGPSNTLQLGVLSSTFTQVPHSHFLTLIMPPTADRVEELLAFQRPIGVYVLRPNHLKLQIIRVIHLGIHCCLCWYRSLYCFALAGSFLFLLLLELVNVAVVVAQRWFNRGFLYPRA
jgi:hypothetical protein